jgi:hypothetical protein
MNVSNLLNQTAVSWDSPSPDGYGGFVYGSPTEIVCRWEDGGEVIEDKEGQQIIADSFVWSESNLDPEGYMYLGTLDDVGSAPTPDEISGAKRIVKKLSVPNISADITVYKYYLK